MSSKPTYTLEPQCRDKGWVPCDEPKAQRFAVLKVQHYTSRGKTMTATRTITSYSTIAEARAAVEALARAAGGKRRPRLGDRWPRTPDSPAPIAKGIGRAPRKDY